MRTSHERIWYHTLWEAPEAMLQKLVHRSDHQIQAQELLGVILALHTFMICLKGGLFTISGDNETGSNGTSRGMLDFEGGEGLTSSRLRATKSAPGDSQGVRHRARRPEAALDIVEARIWTSRKSTAVTARKRSIGRVINYASPRKSVVQELIDAGELIRDTG